MSYETPLGMGWATWRGSMTGRSCPSTHGHAVCFRPGEAAIARRGGCQVITGSRSPAATLSATGCNIGEDGGTLYCCPTDWRARSGSTPATDTDTPSTDSETPGTKQASEDWESQFTYPAELIGQKVEQAVEAVSNLARNVARTVIGQETGQDRGDESVEIGGGGGGGGGGAASPSVPTGAIIAVGALALGGIGLVAFLATRKKGKS